MKIAALTICAALAEMGIDGSVIPALGSGPPHKALSIICPPCSYLRKCKSSSDKKKKKKRIASSRQEPAYLRVTHQHQLGIRTVVMEVINSRRYGSGSLFCRVAI